MLDFPTTEEKLKKIQKYTEKAKVLLFCLFVFKYSYVLNVYIYTIFMNLKKA